MEFMKKVETQVFYVRERSANIKHEKLLRVIEKMEQKKWAKCGKSVCHITLTF